MCWPDAVYRLSAALSGRRAAPARQCAQACRGWLCPPRMSDSEFL